jgi:phosphate transport system protein
MGGLDGEQIADAIEALVKRDTALAERVIAADDRVDALQRGIEEKAVATIARRQAMAVDLREIVGALRIANDLERVGDLAENIAKRVLLLTEDYHINEVMLQLQHMVDLVRGQLARVLQSYERKGRRFSLGCVAQGSEDRRPQYLAVPGTPHLYDGGSPQHHLWQSYAFLRKEH